MIASLIVTIIVVAILVVFAFWLLDLAPIIPVTIKNLVKVLIIILALLYTFGGFIPDSFGSFHSTHVYRHY